MIRTASAWTSRKSRRRMLPLTDKHEIKLKKIGGDVVVTVGDQRRTITLPTALSECSPSGARFEDGILEVNFELGPRPVVAS